MTPEEIKVKLQDLAKPMIEFMRQHDIASFLIPNDDTTDSFDISISSVPLPPRIKCALKRYGSIYMIDK
jgi:hypothetical protein